MIGNLFEMYSQMTKMELKIVHHVFLIYVSRMAKNAFKLATMVEIFEFIYLKWLKMHLNFPQWL